MRISIVVHIWWAIQYTQICYVICKVRSWTFGWASVGSVVSVSQCKTLTICSTNSCRNIWGKCTIWTSSNTEELTEISIWFRIWWTSCHTFLCAVITNLITCTIFSASFASCICPKLLLDWTSKNASPRVCVLVSLLSISQSACWNACLIYKLSKQILGGSLWACSHASTFSIIPKWQRIRRASANTVFWYWISPAFCYTVNRQNALLCIILSIIADRADSHTGIVSKISVCLLGSCWTLVYTWSC